MADKRIEIAPFLDALSELLVARLLGDEPDSAAKREAGKSAKVVALPARAQPNISPRKRARTARR